MFQVREMHKFSPGINLGLANGRAMLASGKKAVGRIPFLADRKQKSLLMYGPLTVGETEGFLLQVMHPSHQRPLKQLHVPPC